MSDTAVSASTDVPHAPAEVFAFLTRPANHVRMDGSGQLVRAVGAGRLTGLGDRFGMKMKHGVPYTVKNTVVEYEQDRRVAWRHISRHRWRFELEPIEGGTRVTETFDMTPVPGLLRPVYRRVFGFPRAYEKMLAATLDNLTRELATATADETG